MNDRILVLMERAKYQFHLLGPFVVENDGIQINISEKLGKQLSSIFAFMLCNHTQQITKEKLIDTFWQESDNPNNAVKYAIYRLRKYLPTIEGMSEEWIITASNGYQINEALSYSIDIEEFEKYIFEAKEKNDIDCYQKAIDLYQGNLLSDIESEWIDVDRGYYRSMIVQACNTLSSNYLEKKQVKLAIQVAEKGLKFDELDEQLISIYLKALIQDKKYNQAMTYYQYINKKYKDKMGMDLENIAGGKFSAILSSQGVSTYDEKDKAYIRKKEEDLSVSGPLEVDAKTLNSICLFVMRNSERIKINGFVLRVVVQSQKESTAKIMNDLATIFKVSFRRSDVLSKIHDNEYALFLNLRKEKDTAIIEKRILSRLSKKYSNLNMISMNWKKI